MKTTTFSKITAIGAALLIGLSGSIAAAEVSARPSRMTQQAFTRVKNATTAKRIERVTRHYGGGKFTRHGKVHFSVKQSKGMDKYLKQLSPNMVEFFITPGFHHLYMRIGDKTYSRISGVSESTYYTSSSERIGVICKLSDAEMGRLKTYVDSAVRDPDRVVGPFVYGGGTPPHASNCTSYITNAPVGSSGKSLARVLGVYESGYPQGFLSSLMRSSSDKVKAVVVHNPTGRFDSNYQLNLD